MEQEENQSFEKYLGKRIADSEIGFFNNNVIKKAYYIGAYSYSVIMASKYSIVSKGNETFKKWLSNQLINYRNLDRIFEMAFRFEQKLKLNIRNESEVRTLVHEVPVGNYVGISSAKITYAFVAGFDDYRKFVKENPIEKKKQNNNNEEK